MKDMLCTVLACLMIFSRIHLTIAGNDNDCKLPPPQKINWSRVKGVWYEILNDKTPIDQIFPCFLAADAKSTANGFSYTLVDTKKNISTEVRVIKQDSGRYIWDENKDDDWIRFWQTEEEVEGKIDISMNMLDEIVQVATGEIVYYTDYENYLMTLRCTNEGEHLGWILGPRQYPTAENILTTFNKLIEIGDGWNDIPLHLSKCALSNANPDPK